MSTDQARIHAFSTYISGNLAAWGFIRPYQAGDPHSHLSVLIDYSMTIAG